MRSATISRCRSPAARTGSPSSSTIRSPGVSPARSAGLSSITSITEQATSRSSSAATRGGNGPGSTGDSQVGATDTTLAHQRADDPPGAGVDRHCQAESDAGDSGVDPDHAAEPVGERAARVARVERRVGLDHVLDQPSAGTVTGRQRAPQRRDHSCGDRARKSERAADRDDQLPDAEAPGITEGGGLGGVDRRPDDGQIRERVGPDDVRAGLTAVGKARDHAGTGCDDVGRGQHVAVGGDRQGTTPARGAPAAPRPPLHPEVRDRGPEPLGNLAHGSRVGIESLIAGRRPAGHAVVGSGSANQGRKAHSLEGSKRRSPAGIAGLPAPPRLAAGSAQITSSAARPSADRGSRSRDRACSAGCSARSRGRSSPARPPPCPSAGCS